MGGGDGYAGLRKTLMMVMMMVVVMMAVMELDDDPFVQTSGLGSH